MKKLIAASAVCLVAGVAAPAYAHTSSPSAAHNGHVAASVSPSKHVKPGQKVTLTGKHGLKKAGYTCLLVILHHKVAGAGTANLTSSVQTTSNKKGTFKCGVTYKPFSGFDKKTVNCPPTKSQKKQGYSCAVAYYDTSTTGAKSDGSVPFTAKK